MEPTANASRPTDPRAPLIDSPPVPARPASPAVTYDNDLYSFSAQANPAAPCEAGASADRFSRWDGNGTAYRVQPPPRREAPAPRVEVIATTRRLNTDDFDDATEATFASDNRHVSPFLPPPRQPARKWPFLAAALLAIVAFALWKAWPTSHHEVTLAAGDAAARQPAYPLPDLTSVPAREWTEPGTTLEEATDPEHSYVVRPADVPQNAPPLIPDITPSAPGVAAAEAADTTPTLVPPPPENSTTQAPPPPASSRSVASKGAARNASHSAARAKAAPAATGTLALAVKPWGEIWVDGIQRGVSPPLLKLQLPAGSHEIELRNTGLPSYRQTLQISPGQTLTLQHRFQ